MVKIYTKTGDDGTTGLIGGARVKKTNSRIAAYGAVDEINSAIGIALSSEIDSDLREMLTRIQNDLFVVGADLANPDSASSSMRVTEKMTGYLEESIDALESALKPITYFILPGGNAVAAQIHFARAVCRRAEVKIIEVSDTENLNRECQVYVNRLSDLLFVMARAINHRNSTGDIAWQK